MSALESFGLFVSVDSAGRLHIGPQSRLTATLRRRIAVSRESLRREAIARQFAPGGRQR